VPETLATYSNLDAITGYAQHGFPWRSTPTRPSPCGPPGTEDTIDQTSLVLDDDIPLAVS
jgi:hypothetical protein